MKKTTTPLVDPKAAAAVPSTPTPSKDVQLEQTKETFLGQMFRPRPDAAAPPIDPEPPKSPATPEPAVTPVATPDPAPTIDLKDTVRKAVTAEMKKQRVPDTLAPAPLPPPVPEKDPNELENRMTKLGLKYTEKRTLEAADWLTRNDQNFKGQDLREDLLKFWEAESAYQSNWEKKHKGEEFKPEDEEHAEFYKREPAIDADALEMAKDKASEERGSKKAAENATAEVQKNLEPQLKKVREIELKERQEKLMPVIRESTEKAIVSMIEIADPEIAKLLEVDGKKGISKEVVEKVKASHPQVFQLLDQEAFLLKHTIAEMEKFAALGQDYQPNFNLVIVDDKGQPVLRDERPVHVHGEIVDFAIQKEDQYAAQPKETSEWDGREFIRIGDFQAKQQAIRDSKMLDKNKKIALEELAEKYWHLDVQMLKDLYTTHVGKKIHKTLDFARRLNGGGAAAVAPVVTTPAPVIPRPAMRGPSTAASVDRLPSTIPGAGGETNQQKEVSSVMFPRR